MLDHGLAPDIDDECDLRPYCCQVRKVLFRTNSDVRATESMFLQSRNETLKHDFVRDEIVGMKGPIRLRKIRHHLPERFIADAVRNPDRAIKRGNDEEARDYRQKPDMNLPRVRHFAVR